MVQAALTGKASSSLRARWNSGSRTSANGLKPAPTELHRCGGSKYPKGPGKTGTRPLGIPTVADRLLQKAVARILEAIFEADFRDASYGTDRGVARMTLCAHYASRS